MCPTDLWISQEPTTIGSLAKESADSTDASSNAKGTL
jgi:hypothetical protein